jgi:stress-induced morphogen
VSRQLDIEATLIAAFQPTHLLVENESHKHSVKPGSETHFSVVVVTASFEGVPLVMRHRRVNEALKAVFASGLHALRIRAATPTELEADPNGLPAPPCLGGSKPAKAAS